MDGKPLVPGKMYHLESGDSIRIDQFRFYISAVRLMQQDSVVYAEPSSYHLVDLADTASLQIHLHFGKPLRFDRVVFCLGIDSLTNVSGAMGGALDPTRGMYWAWQSGYINLKLEGYASNCSERNHEFQYHLGGYLPPANAMQTIRADVSGSSCEIRPDIAAFLRSAPVSKDALVMSPGENAVRLSRAMASLFHPAP